MSFRNNDQRSDEESFAIKNVDFSAFVPHFVEMTRKKINFCHVLRLIGIFILNALETLFLFCVMENYRQSDT
jgi:hypothetical protein